MGPEHAPAVFPLLNDWDVVRMLAQVPWPIAPREVEAHARRSSEEGAEIDDFALAVEETKVGCGSINLAVLISDMQLTRARWRGAET